jgi:class 3 adenylate cyclase/TolB-like protein
VAEQKVKRRLAAILAADIAGYSRLMGEDDVATVRDLKGHQAAVLPLMAEFGGRIIDTAGDGILAEFPSAVGAVECATKLQQVMVARNQDNPESRRMQFRVGINLGDVIHDETRIYGDGINVAARLENIAEPGGICISEDVYRQIRDKLTVPCRDLGEKELKNIAHPVHVYALDLGSHGVVHRRKRSFKFTLRDATLLAAALAIAIAVAAAFPAMVKKFRTPGEAAAATIAVLPFANQSDDAKRDYFSDGVTEDIINALGRFSGIRVAAYNAVRAYKGRNAGRDEVNRDLDVRYLVQGSVRQADGRVRVGVELSDATKGTLLWSERYEGEGKEVFEIQDRVVKDIAGALAVKLTGLEQQRTASKPPESLEAYDLVLRARELLGTSERARNRAARALLAQALQLSPNFAEAWAALAQAEMQRALFGWIEDPSEAVRRAEEAAQRALAVDDPGANARALGVLGSLHTFTGSFDAALVETDRAIELNASDALAYSLRGGVLMWTGRIPESIAASEASRRFDPRLSSEATFNLAFAYYLAGRYRDALAALDAVLRATPDLFFLQAVRAAAAAQLGDAEQARRAAVEVRRLDPFFKVELFGTRLVSPEHRAKAQEGLRKAGL